MKERRSILGHMSLTGHREGSVDLLDLGGRITFGDGDELLRKVVDRMIDEGSRKVVLDFGGVEYMDSSGIDAVVRVFNLLAKVGGKLRIVIATDRIRSLFEITKLSTVMETFGSKEDALQDF